MRPTSGWSSLARQLAVAVHLATAVAEGREYLLARIPDTLRAAGLTPDAAAQMVSAKLGKLLAIDPTVGINMLSVGNSAEALLEVGPATQTRLEQRAGWFPRHQLQLSTQLPLRLGTHNQ